jgi:metallophosphoesterase (TIGR00282 family)
MKYLRILFIGDIVGSSGVYCVKTVLSKLKKERDIDFVIANAEGATGGFGLGKSHSVYLHKLGIDCLTGGECIYYKKDMVDHISKAPYIIRPANYPEENPGRGWRIFQKEDKNIAVINMLGQYGFNRVYLANPFIMVSDIINQIKKRTNIILIDFHATATAEKSTLFYLVDGKVSAVIGTHTKVITADEKILSKGTAVITCAGRTGSFLSVGGFEPEIEIKKFLTQIPERSKADWNHLELQGVIIDINAKGKAESIEKIRIQCKKPEKTSLNH